MGDKREDTQKVLAAVKQQPLEAEDQNLQVLQWPIWADFKTGSVLEGLAVKIPTKAERNVWDWSSFATEEEF